jgi:hypothetical protein
MCQLENRLLVSGGANENKKTKINTKITKRFDFSLFVRFNGFFQELQTTAQFYLNFANDSPKLETINHDLTVAN